MKCKRSDVTPLSLRFSFSEKLLADAEIFLRPALSDMKKFFMLLSVIITIPDIAVLKGNFFLLYFS